MSTPVTALFDQFKSDQFKVAGKAFNSRLIIGTGKYRTYDEMKAAHRASGAAERGRDPLRRLDRARSGQQGHAPRRLFRQRRGRHPGEEGRPDHPGAARRVRGRRQQGVRRGRFRRPEREARQDRGEGRDLRRPERRGRLRRVGRPEARRKASEGNHLLVDGVGA